MAFFSPGVTICGVTDGLGDVQILLKILTIIQMFHDVWIGITYQIIFSYQLIDIIIIFYFLFLSKIPIMYFYIIPSAGSSSYLLLPGYIVLMCHMFHETHIVYIHAVVGTYVRFLVVGLQKNFCPTTKTLTTFKFTKIIFLSLFHRAGQSFKHSGIT